MKASTPKMCHVYVFQWFRVGSIPSIFRRGRLEASPSLDLYCFFPSMWVHVMCHLRTFFPPVKKQNMVGGTRNRAALSSSCPGRSLQNHLLSSILLVWDRSDAMLRKNSGCELIRVAIRNGWLLQLTCDWTVAVDSNSESLEQCLAKMVQVFLVCNGFQWINGFTEIIISTELAAVHPWACCYCCGNCLAQRSQSFFPK